MTNVFYYLYIYIYIYIIIIIFVAKLSCLFLEDDNIRYHF